MNKEQKIKLTSGIAIIAGLFTLFAGIILLLNYLQISRSNPLELESLELLIKRFGDEPNNESLINDIRNLDLLARKAYFNNVWQIKAGSWFLIISSIVFIIALRIYHSTISAIDLPQKSSTNNNIIRVISQRWILTTGIVILLLTFYASYKTIDHLNLYNVSIVNSDTLNEKTESQNPDNSTDENIRIIEITEASDSTENSDSSDKTINESSQITDTKSKVKKVIPKKKVIKEITYASESDINNNYNSFRGPWGNGIADVSNIPVEWDAKSSLNIKWKVEIPKHGYNSPVIWGDKLFIAGGDKISREVYCYNRITGELQWTHILDNIPGSPDNAPKTTDDTGLSAPTVNCNGNSVFAIFGNGDLVAISMNGQRQWAKNMSVPDNHYGHSSSLISWKEKLFIQYDSNKSAKIIALNVNTGDFIWETKRKSRISWASPMLAKINGLYQIILNSTPIVAGYDISNGKELWKVECMMGEVGPSPAYSNGFIYAANEYAKLVAINSANNYKIEWESDEYLPEVSSPVIKDSLLIIATSYGVIACYNGFTGDKYWEYEADNGYYSSPIIADNKIFITDTQGTTFIFSHDSKLSLIGTPKLYENTTSTPSFVNDGLYIRTNNHLFYISGN